MGAGAVGGGEPGGCPQAFPRWRLIGVSPQTLTFWTRVLCTLQQGRRALGCPPVPQAGSRRPEEGLGPSVWVIGKPGFEAAQGQGQTGEPAAEEPSPRVKAEPQAQVRQVYHHRRPADAGEGRDRILLKCKLDFDHVKEESPELAWLGCRENGA